jgi:hypothetical protein
MTTVGSPEASAALSGLANSGAVSRSSSPLTLMTRTPLRSLLVLTEAWAETYAAICLWKQGFREQAELVWAQAMNRPGPFSLLARANAVFFFERWGFDSSVPGPELTAQDEVEALIRERYGVGSP